ncbi:hypothetical protein ACV7JQ_05000 [Globicatella sulfidifaciens]
MVKIFLRKETFSIKKFILLLSGLLISYNNTMGLIANAEESTETSEIVTEQTTSDSSISHFLEVQPFDVNQFVIAGTTSPSAYLKIEISLDHQLYTFDEVADNNGHFYINKEMLFDPNIMIDESLLNSITVTSTSIETNEPIQESLYLPASHPIAQTIQWTPIVSTKANVEFSKTNVGDIFLTGFGEDYIIEAIMSNGEAYQAIFDATGYFYIELPWKLSSAEQFQINIYDANKVLIEAIPIAMETSVADTQAPNAPTLEQNLVAGQMVITGHSEPNTLVLLRSTTQPPVILPTDSTGYFYLELSTPIEEDDIISVFSVDLADNISEQGIIQEIDPNPNRPTIPTIETVIPDSMLVKGKAASNTLIVFKRVMAEKVSFLQTETDKKGDFQINLTTALSPGETLIFYSAQILAYNNIIFSEPVQIVLD